jgi:N-acetylmuramoyl-L-alanine amidase
VIATALWLLPAVARADAYAMLVGSEVRSFDHPPLVRQGGKQWVSGVAVGLGERDPRFTAVELLSGGSARYVALSAAQREGYRLNYSALRNMLQLSGRIDGLNYDSSRGRLTLRALTPVTVSGRQKPEDHTLVELTVEGGWLPDTEPRDYPGDALVTRLSFKSQPELGRTFIFARQPTRIGFTVSTDTVVAAASRPNDGGKLPPPPSVEVLFGNYAALTDLRKSASGEVAVTLQLGSKAEPSAQLLSGPTRLVVDFPGSKIDGAARSYKPQGRATSVRLEQGPTGARLTLGLSSRLDWRILASDGGAQQQVQLLPYASGSGDKRAGRAILLDSGHGGSDVGAIGVVGGVYEKTLNDEITARLDAELRRLGYTVLHTRTQDKFVSLGTRGDYANLLLPWLLVSIHCNKIAADIEGVITFVHPDAGGESRRAAALVHEEFLSSTGANDKRVREEDFFVLRETVIPSLLIECGFMSHTEECGKLCDPSYQQKIAEGIAKGIDRFVLGI